MFRLTNKRENISNFNTHIRFLLAYIWSSGWDYFDSFYHFSHFIDDRDHHTIDNGRLWCEHRWVRVKSVEKKRKNELGRLSVIWLGAQGLTSFLTHKRMRHSTSSNRNSIEESYKSERKKRTEKQKLAVLSRMRMINEKFYGYELFDTWIICNGIVLWNRRICICSFSLFCFDDDAERGDEKSEIKCRHTEKEMQLIFASDYWWFAPFVGCHLYHFLVHFVFPHRAQEGRSSSVTEINWNWAKGKSKLFSFVPLLESKQIINLKISFRMNESKLKSLMNKSSKGSWLSTMINFFSQSSCSYSNSNPPMMHVEWQAIVPHQTRQRAGTSSEDHEPEHARCDDVMKFSNLNILLVHRKHFRT